MRRQAVVMALAASPTITVAAGGSIRGSGDVRDVAAARRPAGVGCTASLSPSLSPRLLPGANATPFRGAVAVTARAKAGAMSDAQALAWLPLAEALAPFASHALEDLLPEAPSLRGGAFHARAARS